MRALRGRAADRRAVALVFLLALVVRVGLLVQYDRRDLAEGYDPATYYTAAAALLHGRLPYHGDFTFLHPPVIVLVGLPFALLGMLTTAHVGYLAANLLGCLLGAGAVAGVVVVARQWGASLPGAVLGATLVALWHTSASAQAVFRLEPLGDALLVAGLVALGGGRHPGLRRLLLAAVAFGLLVDVKVWWVLPLGVVVVLTALRLRSWRVLGILTAGAGTTALLVDLPFLLVPGSRMFHSVITAQAGRPAAQGSPARTYERWSTLTRLDHLSGASAAAEHLLRPATAFDDVRVHAVALTATAVFLVLAVVALRTPLGRFAVALLAAQLLAVLAVPVYFDFYGDFVAVAAGLVVAAAVTVVPRARAAVAVLPVAALAGLLLAAAAPAHPGEAFPDPGRLARIVGTSGCVVADAPRVLIALDVVDRSLSGGCRNVVDVQGVGHGGGPDPRATVAGKHATAAWRRWMSHYLRSADVLVLSDYNVRYHLGRARVAALIRDRPSERSGDVVAFGPRPVR